MGGLVRWEGGKEGREGMGEREIQVGVQGGELELHGEVEGGGGDISRGVFKLAGDLIVQVATAIHSCSSSRLYFPPSYYIPSIITPIKTVLLTPSQSYSLVKIKSHTSTALSASLCSSPATFVVLVLALVFSDDFSRVSAFRRHVGTVNLNLNPFSCQAWASGKSS